MRFLCAWLLPRPPVTTNEFEILYEDDDAVARRATRAPNFSSIDAYIGRLHSAGVDRDKFASALQAIEHDESLRAGDLIAIANGYAVGGTKITSIAAALKRIRHRFIELEREKGNEGIAKKARPW